MPRVVLAVESSASKPRLDRWLAGQMPELSRGRVQELIRAGAVCVAGVATTRSSTLLAPGAEVELNWEPQASHSALTAEAIPLEVIYEDADLVALNKPAGMVVHPGAGRRHGTLVNALLHRYGELPEVSGGDGPSVERPGIVHRLDRFTSGVMVVARNERAHQALAEQFQARTVRKTYFALIQGRLPATVGQPIEIERPIHRDPHHRTRMTTRRPGGRAAHTTCTVRELLGAFSWVELQIHTGRTHQIRVHLAALGHPVVGDRLYGAAAAPPGIPAELIGERVMLHAAELEVTHPRSGERQRWQAPLPAEMQRALLHLRSSK